MFIIGSKKGHENTSICIAALGTCLIRNLIMVHRGERQIIGKISNSLLQNQQYSSLGGPSIEGAILVPEKKFNFFGAPIQKAPEQVLNLQRQLSSSMLGFVWHRSNLGILQGGLRSEKWTFLPNKCKLNSLGVPDELGSQIVLRIYSESQIFRVF